MKKNHTQSGFTLVELLVVIAIIGILIALTLPTIQALRESSRRMTCNNRLAKIAVGMQAYQLANNHFPAGTIDSASQISNVPEGFHHNWVGAILPHIDLKVLYQNIDRSVSVYASENEAVRKMAIAPLRCPSASSSIPPTTSNFAGLYSPVESAISANSMGVLVLNKPMFMQDISDGIEYTVFVGEKLGREGEDLGWISGTRSTLRNAGTAIQTGYAMDQPSPRDSADDPSLFVGGMASAHAGGGHLLSGGGAVQFFSHSGDMRVLQQRVHRSDGGLENFGTSNTDPVQQFEDAQKTSQKTDTSTGQSEENESNKEVAQ